MKKKVWLGLLAGICLLQAAGQNFRVGAAQETINPDGDSLFFAGGKNNRKFIDVADNLYVKAVVISNNETSIALLTVDCIGLMHPQLQEIRERLGKLIPAFPVQQIILSSTHTHSGPDVVGIWGQDIVHSGLNEAHMNKIVSQATVALQKAWNNRKSGIARYAVGSFGEDWVKNISEPGLLDRTVTILQFKDALNKNIATLVNFACHPTILDDVARGASSDYVGGFYRYLDSAQGGTNLFLQGAIGGWVQPEDVPKTYEQAMRIGDRLGTYVLKRLQQPQTLNNSQIVYRRQKVKFPLQNPGFRQLSQMGVIKRVFGDSVDSEIAYASIGNLALATHPGETSPALSYTTRAMMKNNGPKMVLGLSMDALGYILKPGYFEEGNKIPHSNYLTSMSIGPQTMDIITETLKSLIK
ncbi:MAG: hypothetical protein ACKOOA_11185 [Sediminibacterium sp.]